jgi:Flp pilus assembly protein TadB
MDNELDITTIDPELVAILLEGEIAQLLIVVIIVMVLAGVALAYWFIREVFRDINGHRS